MVVLLNKCVLIAAFVTLFSCKSSIDCGERSKYIYDSVRFEKSINGKYCVSKVLSVQEKGKAKITGYVLDRIGGNFLAAEIIFDEKKKLGQMTDEKGFFEYVIEPGKYRIKVQHVGFTTLRTKDIELRPNTSTEIFFYLGTTVVR